MLGRFLDWSHDQGTAGMLIFIIVGTFACCTGIIFILIFFDWLEGHEAEAERNRQAQEFGDQMKKVLDSWETYYDDNDDK